jgi:ribosomal protein S18 acetylase RimI-like enzyme
MPSQPTRPLQIRPDDPFVRWVIGGREPTGLVAEGDCCAWLGRASRPGEAWVTGLGGSPDVVAGLVAEVAGRYPVDGVTVPEDAFDRLPEPLRSPDPGHWCFWWRDVRDLPDAGRAQVLEDDDPRIAPLLAHSSSAHVFPGDPSVVRWAGVVDSGTLLSVAGQRVEPTGAAHLVSVCTEPSARGRGLAGQACAALMQAAVADGAPVIVLEMYVANEAGRATYRRLGFTEAGRFRSGLLRP